MSKTMRCGSVLIRADEVLFAIANTGDTSEVFLRNGRSVIVNMCLAEFGDVWNNALNEIEPNSNKPLRNCDVGTPDEQAKRYAKFCNGHFTPSDIVGDCHKCPLEDKRKMGGHCSFYWAQMPYEKGETDGRK